VLLPGLLTLAAGCGSAAGSSSCGAEAIDPGVIEATVDGESWEGGAATWMLAGASLQINSASAGGWWLSAVAQTTVDGAGVGDALAAGDLPAEVDLPESGAGGWATFYPDSGDSYSTKLAAGGTLTLVKQDGADLLGCFAFVAANGAGDEVTVESGRFRAAEGLALD
jgi:hypothetical protein